MRRWNAAKVPPIEWRPGKSLFRPKALLIRNHSLRYSSQESTPETAGKQETRRGFERYDVFTRIQPPERRVDDWASLLDGALPPHLRTWQTSPPTLSTVDVAEILLAAQHPRNPKEEAFDLLFYLGFEKGRWAAVVWLIKRLVEKFPVRHGQTGRLQNATAMWNQISSFEDFIGSSKPSGYDLNMAESLPKSGLVDVTTLDMLTAGHAENSSPKTLQHDALGQIWRTLGAMTKACTGSEIRSEALEIIAYLHHKEVMPVSIYSSHPHSDASAIQQPPLLSFLSSRILTSLSDAAWRAHEKLVIDEAKARGGEYAAIRPEIPGSVYRVHVAGLRPEVWMELILWSCIHGGWINQGAEILRSIADDPGWKALSWREYERSMAPSSRLDETWEYVFKTRASTTMDAPAGLPFQVDRTVSAEVINAYIDALVTSVSVSVGGRGLSIRSAIILLRKFKNLLDISAPKLSLSTGTWDALIVRLIEAQNIMLESNPDAASALVTMSPGFGQGLDQENTRDLPAYVLDGSMATQGMLHRVLYGKIMNGRFTSAISTFNQIQNRADSDMRQSLSSFMEEQKSVMRTVSKDNIFTSNLSGIEYPAFNVQIPTTVLGPLLDLATTSQHYDFGRWLLYNDDLDGPLIRQDMYHDRVMQPAIIRFAADTNDQALLQCFKGTKLQHQSLRAVLNTQFNALKFESVSRILEHMARQRIPWSALNLAYAMRTMLQQTSSSQAVDSHPQGPYMQAISVVKDMCAGRYGVGGRPGDDDELCVRNLIVMLAAVDPSWQKSCRARLQARHFDKCVLPAHVFNVVLEGVVSARGSASGRRLLGIFWPHAARGLNNASRRLTSVALGDAKTATYSARYLDSVKDLRIAVRLGPDGTGRINELVLYGAVVPNVETILIILRKALDEFPIGESSIQSMKSLDAMKDMPSEHDDGMGVVDTSPRGMVIWGIRRLAALPGVDGPIVEQLGEILAARGLDELRDKLPEIVQEAQHDFDVLPQAMRSL